MYDQSNSNPTSGSQQSPPEPGELSSELKQPVETVPVVDASGDLLLNPSELETSTSASFLRNSGEKFIGPNKYDLDKKRNEMDIYPTSYSKTMNKIGSKIQIKELLSLKTKPELQGSQHFINAPEDKLKIKDVNMQLSEPLDRATKTLIDLEEQVNVYLSAEEAATTLLPAVYGAGAPIGEMSESLDRQVNQIQSLVEQINGLTATLEHTISDLTSHRRYVAAAMVRSLQNYVRRTRFNLERLQTRLVALQAAATSGQGNTSLPSPSFFNSIKDRVNNLSEEIGNLMTRVRYTFVPSSTTSSG